MVVDFLKRREFAPKRLGVAHRRRNLVVFRSAGILHKLLISTNFVLYTTQSLFFFGLCAYKPMLVGTADLAPECEVYSRDRGEELHEPTLWADRWQRSHEAFDRFWANYCYLFMDGEWHVSAGQSWLPGAELLDEFCPHGLDCYPWR